MKVKGIWRSAFLTAFDLEDLSVVLAAFLVGWVILLTGMHFWDVSSKCLSFCELLVAMSAGMFSHLISGSYLSHFSSTLVFDCLWDPPDHLLPVLKEIFHANAPVFDAFINHECVFHFCEREFVGERGEEDSRGDLDVVLSRQSESPGDVEDLWRFGLHLSKYYRKTLAPTSRRVFIATCLNKYIVKPANLNWNHYPLIHNQTQTLSNTMDRSNPLRSNLPNKRDLLQDYPIGSDQHKTVSYSKNSQKKNTLISTGYPTYSADSRSCNQV